MRGLSSNLSISASVYCFIVNEYGYELRVVEASPCDMDVIIRLVRCANRVYFIILQQSIVVDW